MEMIWHIAMITCSHVPVDRDGRDGPVNVLPIAIANVCLMNDSVRKT